MACPQNNVLASLLLANKRTREDILPLVDAYKKKSVAASVNNVNSAEALFAKNKLMTKVYDFLMTWDQWEIYRPLLVDKITKSFRAKGYLQWEKLQKVLSSLMEKWDVVDMEKEVWQINAVIGLLKKSGIIDDTFSLETSVNQLQKQLNLEYFSDTGNKLKIDGKVVTKAQWLEHYTWENELPDSVKNSPVYKTIEALHWEKDTNKLYAKYRALLSGDKKAKVGKGYKWNKVIEESTDVEWLSNLLVQKIDDDAIVDSIVNRLDELRVESDSNIMTIIKAITKNDEDMIKTMQWSLQDKLNYLNEIHGTNVWMEEFDKWLKKEHNHKNLEISLDKSISNAVNTRIKNWQNSDKVADMGIPQEFVNTMAWYFRNYYRSQQWLWGLGIVNKIADTSLREPENLVFVKMPSFSTEEVGKAIADKFSKTKLAYRINGPEIASVELDKLDAYLKANPNTSGVIVQSQIQRWDERLIEATWDFKIVSPNSNDWTIFDHYEGRLVIANDNFWRLNKLKKQAEENGFYNKPVNDGEKVGEALDEYISLLYPDRKKTIHKLIKSQLPKNASAIDLENFIRIASTVDRNSQTVLVDLSKIDVEDTDVLNFLRYLEANYGKVDTNPFQSRAIGESKLLTEVGTITDLLPEANIKDLWYTMSKSLFYNGFSMTVRWEWMDEFVQFIKDWGNIEDASWYVFWENLLRSNKHNSADDMMKNIQESITTFKPSVASKKPASWLQYYVVTDKTRYATPYELLDNISNIENLKAGELMELSNSLYKNIDTAIDEYVADVTERIGKLKDWEQLDYSVARSMKQKLVNTLMENELQLTKINAMKWETNTFGVNSIYTKQWLDWFEDSIKSLKEQYGLSKTDLEKKVKSNPDELIAQWEDVLVVNGKDTASIKLDELIAQEVENMPRQINIPRMSELTKEQKGSMYFALRAAKKNFTISKGIYNITADGYVPWLGNWIDDMKNTPIVVGDKVYKMPLALQANNTLQDAWINLGLEADFHIKYEILTDISNIMKQETLEPSKLESIIKTVLEKNWLSPEQIDNVSADYMYSFFNYTLLPKMEESILKEAVKLIQPPKLTMEQNMFYNDITYTDVDGKTKYVASMIRELNTDKYPDILHNTMWAEDFSKVIGGVEVDKSVVKRNVLLAVDEAANDMQRKWLFDDWVMTWVKQQAKNPMNSSARLRAAGQIDSKLIEPGILAADWLRPLSANAQTRKNTLLWWIWYGWIYEPSYINKLLGDTAQLMAKSEQDFIDFALKADNANAVHLANYLRTLKKNLTWLTTDTRLNAELVKSVDWLLDGIIELKDGKAVFQTGKWFGIQRLEWLEKSMRHGAFLYGLKPLQDLDIRYIKTKTKKAFGFGNTYYDEISDLEPLAKFNELFNSNLELNDYRIVVGSLIGDITENAASKAPTLKRMWNVANSPFFRLFSAIPWSIYTGIPSAVGYINTLSQLQKFNKSFNNWEGIWEFRSQFSILSSSSSDVKSIFNLSEWDHALENVLNITYSKWGINQKAMRDFFWQWFDNGQNIVDGIYASAVKDESLISAIKSEWFHSLEDFNQFLNNPLGDIDGKRMVYDAIVKKAYDMHEWLINYTGRATTRNIDTGNAWSKANGVVMWILNPLNFRAGLGNNMIVNAFNNAWTIIQHFKRYGWDINKISESLGSDPNMMRFLYSITQDAAMSLKVANLNDYGELDENRELWWNDISAWLDMLSQPAQFVRMSAGARVLASTLFDDWNAAYNFLHAYSMNAFRGLKTSWQFLEFARVLATGDMENAAAAFRVLMMQASTASMRYMLQTWDKVIENDTGIPPMFGWSNKYQDLAYYDATMQGLVKDFGKTWDIKTGWKIARNIMLASNPGRMIQTAGQIGVEALWLINKDAGKSVAKAFWIDYKKSYINTGIAITDFKNSEFADKIVNGKYQFYRLTEDWVWADYDKYRTEINVMLDEIKLDYVAGSEDFAEMFDAFKKNGTTEFTTTRWWDVYDNPAMTKVLESMKEDWTLDTIYKQIRTSNNKAQTEGLVTSYMINYISQMKEKPLNYDQLQEQIANSYLFKTQIGDDTTEYKKDGKKSTGNKKYQLDNYEKMDIYAKFLQKHWDRYQEVVSDGYYSSAGVDVATKLYAKSNPEIMETLFDLDKDGNPKKLKSKYDKAIKNTYQLEADLAKGIAPRTVVQGIYGPYSLYAQSVWWEYNQQANLEWVLYMRDFINAQAYTTSEEKAHLGIKAMMSMPVGALDIKDIEDTMWPEVANDYRRNLNQATQDAYALVNAELDRQRTNGTGKWKSSAISIPDLWKFLEDVKQYQSKNAADYWKPIKFKENKPKFIWMSDKSQWEAAIRPPKIPSYDAKSEPLFKAPKSKAKPKLKAAKRKTSLKTIKL